MLIRLTDTEHKMLQAKAREMGLSMSGYIRLLIKGLRYKQLNFR